MIHSQNLMIAPLTPPGAKIDDTSATTATLDTAGYSYCTIYCHLGDTDVAMSVLKVQESDNGDLTGVEDVAGLEFGTSVNTDGDVSDLPGAGDDSEFFAFEIDLRSRKRYLDLVATAGNGSTGVYFTAWAVLTGGENKNAAADRGLNQILRV